MLKTVVLDSESLVRRAMSDLLNKFSDINVVKEFGSGEELMKYVRKEQVSLVVMEWRLASLDGLELLARLVKAHPKIKIVVLSSHLSGNIPLYIWQMGVAGLISRNDSMSELDKTVAKVIRGERCISAEVSKNMVSDIFINNEKSPFETLTQREMQVMLMIIEGLSVQEIAERLYISKKTVNTYRYRLFEKLDVKNEVDMTRLAMRHGVISEITSESLAVADQSISAQQGGIMH